ncbi:translationally controlled tumor protein [Dipodascopsis uninucleata]
MLLYKDIISGDELVSDAYDIKLVDDVVYEVNCHMVQIKEGADIDIGANPSAEEGGEEELEEGVVTVNDIVHSFRLQQTSFDKKSFLTYIKGYMKTIKAKLNETSPDEVAAFEKGAQAYIKKVVANFKDYEFFTGESMDPEAMIVLLNYREDGVTPYIIIWKHGVKEEKF